MSWFERDWEEERREIWASSLLLHLSDYFLFKLLKGCWMVMFFRVLLTLGNKAGMYTTPHRELFWSEDYISKILVNNLSEGLQEPLLARQDLLCYVFWCNLDSASKSTYWSLRVSIQQFFFLSLPWRQVVVYSLCSLFCLKIKTNYYWTYNIRYRVKKASLGCSSNKL